MSVRLHSLSDARLLLAAMLAVFAMARTTAYAQNVNGSFAVSATILPPVARQVTRLTAFNVARHGTAQLETTAPIAGPISQIVMWSVSSSANGFVPVEQAPMLIEPAHHSELEELTSSRERRPARLRFEVDLGATSTSPVDSGWRNSNLTVRLHYLIVPGT